MARKSTNTPTLAVKEPDAAALRREIAERREEAEDLEARARELAISDPSASVDADTRAQATSRLIPRLQKALDAFIRKDKDARIATAEAEIDAQVRESLLEKEKSITVFQHRMMLFEQHYNLLAQSERLQEFVSLVEEAAAISIPSMRRVHDAFIHYAYAIRVREKDLIEQRAKVEKAHRRYEIENEPAGN
jgi:hypothetical protein